MVEIILVALLINMAAAVFADLFNQKLVRWKREHPLFVWLTGLTLLSLATVLVVLSRLIHATTFIFVPRVIEIPIPIGTRTSPSIPSALCLATSIFIFSILFDIIMQQQSGWRQHAREMLTTSIWSAWQTLISSAFVIALYKVSAYSRPENFMYGGPVLPLFMSIFFSFVILMASALAVTFLPRLSPSSTIAYNAILGTISLSLLTLVIVL
jgi:hypothetical protein